MTWNDSNINEGKVATAFSKQADIFDSIYSTDGIIQYKRERVRDHLKQYLGTRSNVLELNSGTGEDAIWLAKQGHWVHATDISENMQQVLSQKVKANKMESRISNEQCSFTCLNQLHFKGPYDMIFSNFAGLNCTGDLDKILQSFSALLKPGGIVTLVMLPPFCLWETMLLFKGMFKTATRRFPKKNGTPAKVEGLSFNCWYYKPSYITGHLKEEYTVLNLEGLCTIVPPSYISHFAEKHPALFTWLKVIENKWKNKWPWKFIGDYYIISLQKKCPA